ncbi:hypothetical protein CLPU_5c02030 [Gottschalkia purinilytica]|uniref:Uncharacterized protein n=1 Tax=Gottschalkia purinilytica TaxID=1503 RepID=A0A0L0WBP0_GOTPU|nr:hypothetical protein [Gottschalkia purinilytica]KNF08896.1 hypothetical protein CLPU_5c02030 [Gottschalkia purinilytica]
MQKPFTTNRIKQTLKKISNSVEHNKESTNLLKLAEEKINKNDVDTALELLKKSLSIDPSNPYVYYLISKYI